MLPVDLYRFRYFACTALSWVSRVWAFEVPLEGEGVGVDFDADADAGFRIDMDIGIGDGSMVVTRLRLQSVKQDARSVSCELLLLIPIIFALYSTRPPRQWPSESQRSVLR
jgi:hypothetical protein